MAATDREKWNSRYATASGPDKPSQLLVDLFQAPAWTIQAGCALDIATGNGRNALFLAARGFDVEAIDVSPVALATARNRADKQKLRVSWREADLEAIVLPHARYDLILNFDYLQRSLIPQLKLALKTGGLIMFETYLIDQRAFGHPSNPAYLLDHNELLEKFRDFRVLLYREGNFAADGGFRAGIFAQKIG